MSRSAAADNWATASSLLRNATAPIPADQLTDLIRQHRRFDREHRRMRCIEIEDTILRSYLKMIVGTVNRCWRTFPECYEEALQEATRQAIRAIRQWDPRGGANLSTYMIKAVQNRMTNYRRDVVMKHVTVSDNNELRTQIISKRQVRYCESIDSVREGSDAPFIEPIDQHAQDPARKALIMDVEQAMKSGFPEREAKVLRMYFYQGMTFDEIGKKINLTRARTHQLCSKAVQLLQRRFRVVPEGKALATCIRMTNTHRKYLRRAA